MELQRAAQKLRATLAKQEQEYEKLRNEILNVDNEHNNIMTELQREDMKSKKNWSVDMHSYGKIGCATVYLSRDNYEQMKSDGKHLQSELDRMITHRPAKVS